MGVEWGAARGVTSRKDLGGGAGAFAFRDCWCGFPLVGKVVDFATVVGGRDGIRGGGRERKPEGASRSSSSVSDDESLAA